MRNILTLFGKEIRHYTGSAASVVVAFLFVELAAIFFVSYLISTSYADTSIRGFVNSSRFLIPLFAVFITMRVLSEERKSGTWELLMTSPLADHQIVLGKFLGSLAFMAVMLAVTLYFPAILMVFGDPDLGPMATSYLALLLLGSACLSIGVFSSAMTANPLLAAVLAASILLLLWLLGSAESLLPSPIGDIVAGFSISGHLSNFFRGVIDSRDVVYYVTVTGLFLYLASVAIASERVR